MAIQRRLKPLTGYRPYLQRRVEDIVDRGGAFHFDALVVGTRDQMVAIWTKPNAANRATVCLEFRRFTIPVPYSNVNSAGVCGMVTDAVACHRRTVWSLAPDAINDRVGQNATEYTAP